jgi:CO/xanthine dehydrogenase Mo-binding subunit
VSDELHTCAGYICGPEGELVTFRQAVLEYLESLGPLVVTKLYEPPGEFDVVTNKGDAFASYGWGAEVVEVEVDPDTLEVRPTSLTAVCDVGKVVHPTLCRGQIEGAALQGLGFGLLEEARYGDDGHLIHDRLARYNTPTFKDAPQIDVHFLENPYEGGPFGARGAGELATDGTAPAAAQAVENATGHSLSEIPVTPERLVRSILRNRA